ncbi:hypothetical protein P43SY_002897 [Pythium insidiosum]|uniref:Uncharacterized protein n=1 Tax=Pythium insidiosum TaxID=114742 RepID=A0AAD5Q1J7_PYTIN|nr:hypothetical protein P43SY_002897 [Pythium insidiosum]
MVQWLSTKYAQVVDAQGHLQLPLPKEAMLGFFGHLSGPAHECDINSIHADDAESPSLSVSCVTGYKSALVDLYRTHEVELDSALNEELKSVLDGYEKTINGPKQRGLMEVNDGKRHLKSNGYDLLAHELFTQTRDAKGQSWATIVFAWSYFVLMWNLMSRSDSVDKIMLQHIDWAEDALIVEEQGHKGDQTGADKFGKHVYANPYEPSKFLPPHFGPEIGHELTNAFWQGTLIVRPLNKKTIGRRSSSSTALNAFPASGDTFGDNLLKLWTQFGSFVKGRAVRTDSGWWGVEPAQMSDQPRLARFK